MNAKAAGKSQTGILEAMTRRYAVETLFTYGWENCWKDERGKPLTFATYEEAEDAMKDHIIDCINSVEGGFLEDSPDPTDLRVVPV